MKIFGKKIGIVAVLMLLVIGVGSAAVVSYLSNQVEAEVAVSSPFEVGLCDTYSGTYVDTLPLADVRGGDTSTFYIKCVNQANQPIDVQVETLITCDATGILNPLYGNISHADFEDDNDVEGTHANAAIREAHGIMVDAKFGNSDPIYSGAVNVEPITHLRTVGQGGLSLAVCGGASSLWEQEFPAGRTVIVEVTLHHAPGALGDYTITTEVQDDNTPWI